MLIRPLEALIPAAVRLLLIAGPLEVITELPPMSDGSADSSSMLMSVLSPASATIVIDRVSEVKQASNMR